MTHSMHSTFTQAAAEGIDREIAFQRDASVLNERATFTFFAEAGGFEPVERRWVESVVQLRRIHVIRSQPGRAPQLSRQRATAFHVIVERIVQQGASRSGILS